MYLAVMFGPGAPVSAPMCHGRFTPISGLHQPSLVIAHVGRERCVRAMHVLTGMFPKVHIGVECRHLRNADNDSKRIIDN